MNLDKVTTDNFPLVAASHTGELEPSEKFGIRYVVGSNGLWRAIDKSWLKAVVPIALLNGAVVPYGKVAHSIEFTCSMPPVGLWREFYELAKQALPNEVAAAMVWDSGTDVWRLAARQSITANDAYVSYREVELKESEEIVVDIHSHASHLAYFSDTDDKDDFGSIKVCAVLGQVGTSSIQLVARLMLIDQTIDLEMTPSGGWKTRDKIDNETQNSH